MLNSNPFPKEQKLPQETNWDPKIFKTLQSIDTPTVCNAIEVAQGKRGFSAFTQKTMISSAPESTPIVGFARTAKISALQPSTDPISITRKKRMDYYEYMAKSELPAVSVIEDIDFPNCIGAYWGEINTSIHKSFGIIGAITNGVMRDLGDLPEAFTVIANSVGPSHGFVHVKEINTEVNICGLKVSPGDLVHADRHGAVIIPTELIYHIEEAIIKLLRSERIILDETKKGKLDFAKFSEIWEKFEKSRV